MIRPRPHLEALASFQLADLSAPPGKRLIQLAQNESAWPASPKALAAAGEALAGAGRYPDTSWRELVAAIAAVHRIDPAKILCAPGSMDLIGALIRAFAGPGDEVLSTAHAYGFFRTSALAGEAAYRTVEEPDLTVSVDLLLDAIGSATRIVCVANPGNPTGTRISGAELVRLRDGMPDNVLLLIDEAYAEFCDDAGAQVFDLVERGDTVVTRTFSKAYALAGMRVGWGLFPTAIGAQVQKLLTVGAVTVASLAAAAAAMLDRAHMRTIVRETVAVREMFADGLGRIGIDAVPSSTNFVLARFGDAGIAASARAALLAEAIIVRPMAGYGLPDALRITIGPRQDMEFVLGILADWKRRNHR